MLDIWTTYLRNTVTGRDTVEIQIMLEYKNAGVQIMLEYKYTRETRTEGIRSL